MMKAILTLAATGLLLATTQIAGATAQSLAGDDIASLGLHLGAVAPRTTLPDGAAFDGGLVGGISLNFWRLNYVGLNGTILYGKHSGDPGPNNAVAGQEDPSVLIYDLEAAFRWPVGSGSSRFLWFPYVGVGIGGKTYRWSEWLTGHEWDTTYSWGFSTGVEVRPSRSPVGFLLELKRYDSHYKWHGFHIEEPIVTDMILTTGITISR